LKSRTEDLITFVKNRRKKLGMTQRDLAHNAGVGLRFVRDLDQGKQTLRLDKINQVLALFGYKMGPVKIEDRDEL
jgi:y4mF family transcriptional regulator